MTKVLWLVIEVFPDYAICATMGFRPFRLFRMPLEFQLLLMLLLLQNKTKVLISLSLFYKKQCFSFTKDSFEDAVYIVWQKQKTPISWEKWTIWG